MKINNKSLRILWKSFDKSQKISETLLNLRPNRAPSSSTTRTSSKIERLEIINPHPTPNRTHESHLNENRSTSTKIESNFAICYFLVSHSCQICSTCLWFDTAMTLQFFNGNGNIESEHVNEGTCFGKFINHHGRFMNQPDVEELFYRPMKNIRGFFVHILPIFKKIDPCIFYRVVYQNPTS